VVMSFPLICNWFLWKIARDKKVQIVLDPWIANNEAYMLPPRLIMEFKSWGYHYIRQVYQVVRTLDRTQWEEIGYERRMQKFGNVLMGRSDHSSTQRKQLGLRSLEQNQVVWCSYFWRVSRLY
jgi:hypothetical protein